jgi:uncharacterized membrane protein YfcA
VTLLQALAVFVAGVAAGTFNTVVGSGTLVTFPTLLAVGYPPVLANVSNTVGLVPGSLSGALGYRRELTGQRSRLVRLGAASALGGALGAVLLLTLPSSTFDAVVPVLIGVGCVLVVAQPWIAAHMRPPAFTRADGSPVVWALVFVTGVYGGYFGAGQSVLLIAVLGLGLTESLQRVNAAKNVLALLVNVIAAAVFLVATSISWLAAGLIAAGSVCGGQLGARIGRRLPAPVLRGVVAVVGVIAILNLVVLN